MSNTTIDYACYSLDMFKTDTLVMASHYTFLYVSIMLVTIGLCGNGISGAVFLSRGMRTISSHFYLLMLAISDSLYMVSVFLAKVLTHMRCLYMRESTMDIYNRSDITCKMLQLFMDVFSDYSPCLILAFTIERFLAVTMPLRVKQICTIPRARVTCFVLLALITLSTMPYHVIMLGLHEFFPVCMVKLDYEDMYSLLYLFEVIVYRIIPVILIGIFNLFIIIRVVTSPRIRTGSHLNEAETERNRQLTITLILVSSVYVITYIPVLIHHWIWKLVRLGKIDLDIRDLNIVQNFANSLYIFGFASNFFLYNLSNKSFRKQLSNISGCASIFWSPSLSNQTSKGLTRETDDNI